MTDVHLSVERYLGPKSLWWIRHRAPEGTYKIDGESFRRKRTYFPDTDKWGDATVMTVAVVREAKGRPLPIGCRSWQKGERQVILTEEIYVRHEADGQS